MFLLRKYKPHSPGIRHKVMFKNFYFFKKHKHYFFLQNKANLGGTNHTGKVVVSHKSAKVKKKIVTINQLRLNSVIIGILIGIFKLKYNSCFVGLIKYSNGMFNYIYLAHGIILTNYIYPNNYNTKKLTFTLGSLYFFVLSYLKLRFFNICSFYKKRSIYARAGGVFCTFIVKNFDRGFIKIFLPSKQVKYIPFDYYCTLGRASNIFIYKQVLGKAGYSRKLGIRPTTCGVAMNPVDHPNGGRTKTNKPEKTP